ncbi:hypothetical protein BC628DRAFT_1331081 [Trametes gibbosa]|nr:hypothetical protein BC628DRAFT_1331081 [Trametes gibbosa]
MLEQSTNTLPEFRGDIAIDRQEAIRSFSELVTKRSPFSQSIGSELVFTEVEVFRRTKDGRVHAQTTYEIVMREDMLNIGGMLHGSCAVYLIDLCSSLLIATLGLATGQPWDFVSQTITTTYHAPISPGMKLEIINKTLSFGSRTATTVTEIWDATSHRLCVTGMHNLMKPTVPSVVRPKM